MKPHKIYGEDTIDPKALNQFYEALKQPATIKGALMPDAHLGYTLPIGAVILTDNIIFPSYVGFDIGCGVCALKTSFSKREVIAHGPQIYDRILQHIPVGFKHRGQAIGWSEMPKATQKGKEIFNDKKGFKQLGTLGGGNHFIEVGYDELDHVWITIHSGSRGVGHGIATHYMKLASKSTKAKEGHYGMSLETQDGQDYLTDLKFAQAFAFANRKHMLCEVIGDIAYLLKDFGPSLSDKDIINRNHNHAEVVPSTWGDGGTYENLGRDRVIHRKGATHAGLGMLGVIPGNMRDGSFIVRGLGNPDSLSSSSHGAGRVLGRNQAKKTLVLGEFEGEMKDVICETRGHLDEAPGAYKDIFRVMEVQKGLVEVLHHVKPLINIKG